MGRYYLKGSKWYKKKLTYRLSSVAMSIPQEETVTAMEEAFAAWTSVSSLWIKMAPEFTRPDIEIKFVTRDHGDGFPFDGPGGTLGHAFSPRMRGPIHFDNQENWVVGEEYGYDLKLVAMHEIGHSLGIGHSSTFEAMMFPYYSREVDRLHTDDINAVQALYGNKTDAPTPVRSSLDRCDPKFDAVTVMKNGIIFAFSGNFLWKLNEQGMEEKSLQTIQSVWGLRGTVDASLTHGEFTDLFQDEHVRRYINDKPVEGYPILISEQYPGMPSHIDAAWSSNGLIYFAKGGKYWVFNSATNQAHTGYPRLISQWKDLPETIDAAVQWNGLTYFFSNDQYWRFNDKKESEYLNGTQKANKWWPGCSKNSDLSSSKEAAMNGARLTSGISFQ